MQQKQPLILLLVLLVGVGVGYSFSSKKDMSGMHMMPTGQMMQNSMEGMTADLEGKTGDEFDKAFLSGMIIHHEGAIEMAEAALQKAKHQEIKTMADAIISAQTSEIAQMRQWLRDWYNE
jgi:uncharacterized protein (DUF305 family)